jgi:hypothetical protein
MKINEALANLIQPLGILNSDPENARDHNEESYKAIAASYSEFGQQKPVVGVRESNNTITVVDGNGQLEAARRLGWGGLAVVVLDDPTKAKRYALAINRIAELSTWNPERLQAALTEISSQFGDIGFEGTGFTVDDFKLFDQPTKEPEEKSYVTGEKRRLKDRFLLPPFTILDTRTVVWQERRRDWLSLGLKSEQGRKAGMTFHVKEFDVDTSVFDPVLCELVYRWFLPDAKDGAPLRVLDPMCGGSVRGAVAAALGCDYTGVDLRQEQVDANVLQWAAVRKALGHGAPLGLHTRDEITDGLTPVTVNRDTGVFLKREDLYRFGEAKGSKARACVTEMRLHEHAPGYVMAASRLSPAVATAAAVAKELGKPIRVHMAKGALTPSVDAAVKSGAEIVWHDKGLANALSATASDDAVRSGRHYVQWGFQSVLTAKVIADQFTPFGSGVPKEAKRIVVAVDSGLTLAGILHAIQRYESLPRNVLGVVVGKDPTRRVDAFAPVGWRKHVTFVNSPLSYDTPGVAAHYGAVPLDPFREGKCAPFLESGDLLWVGGESQVSLDHTERMSSTLVDPRWVQGDATSLPHSVRCSEYDLVFTCPPYGDLEVYSDNPADLSRMSQEEFVVAWRKVIANAAACLRPERFAVVVIGDYRDKKSGCYQNFQGVTVAAFESVGMRLYNEAIVVNSAGTLGFRINQQWPSRKMGRQHQTVLAFVKGDARKLTEHFTNMDGVVDTE